MDDTEEIRYKDKLNAVVTPLISSNTCEGSISSSYSAKVRVPLGFLSLVVYKNGACSCGLASKGYGSVLVFWNKINTGFNTRPRQRYPPVHLHAGIVD